MVSVCTTGHATKCYHVKDVGLVLVEPNAQISWADGVSRERSDKVELTLLLTLGPLEVYSAKAWEEAAEAVRL